MNFFEMHAIEKLGLPAGWTLHTYRCLPVRGPTQVYELVGCVPNGVYTKGSRKGRPNFRDGLHDATALISVDEHNAWLDAWEQRSGKCWRCEGSGKESSGWSAVEGQTYRPCSRCKETGKP